MHTGSPTPDRATVLYRLEVAGPVPESWGQWFDADTVTPSGPNTILEVRVFDQAALYGRLRRIHDLNLHLIAVQRMDADAAADPAGNADPAAGSPANDNETPGGI